MLTSSILLLRIRGYTYSVMLDYVINQSFVPSCSEIRLSRSDICVILISIVFNVLFSFLFLSFGFIKWHTPHNISNRNIFIEKQLQPRLTISV